MLNWLGSLKCPDCGGRITEQEKYCPHCGADLDAPVQRSQEDALQYFDRAQKTYDRNGSMDDALLDCELALQYNPEFAEAHNLHGLILDALERPRKAIKAYRRALELNPNLEDARANIKDFEAEHGEYKTLSDPQDKFELDTGLEEAKTDLMDDEAEQDNESVIYVNKQSLEKRGVHKEEVKRFILAAIKAPIILFSIACIFWFANKFTGIYLGPKSLVVFEMDTSIVSSFEKNDLQATVEILTTRCRELGYGTITFYISDQNEIKGEIPNSLNPQKVADEIKNIGLLEFVDFGSQAHPEGQQIRTDQNDKYFQNFLQGAVFHTVLSNEAIKTAAALESQSGYSISFVLTEEAAQLFADYTATHRGEYLGIVLDGVVVSVPVIDQPITGGEGSISGSFTEEEAKKLAAILRTKPLPIPIRIKQIINN
jgi:tetratricopeptide (TPR) repeat protein